MMSTKLFPAIPGAAAVTALIILAMHALIEMQPMALDKRTYHELGSIILKRRDETLITDQFQPERIDKPEPTPPLQPREDFDEGKNPVGIPVHTPLPRNPGPDFGPTPMQDGPLVVIVRVQPTYPSGPLSQGLEGWATVKFDVLPDGSVANVRILESSSRAFERSAIQAASKFRYKARVVSGEPQVTHGVVYRFRFEMNK